MGKAFAEAIKAAFAENVLEQKDLHVRLGLKPSAITRWKSGENTPERDQLVKLLALVPNREQAHRLRQAWLCDRTPPEVWDELRNHRAKGPAPSTFAAATERIAAALPERYLGKFAQLLHSLNDMVDLGPRANLAVFRDLAVMATAAWKDARDNPGEGQADTNADERPDKGHG